MNAILALIPIPWRIVACFVVALVLGGSFGAGAVKGYSSGYGAAKAEGDAAIAKLQADYNERAAKAAQEFADEIVRQTTVAQQATAKFNEEEKRHATTRSSLEKRIETVTRNSTHRFSAEFVRVFNTATSAITVGRDAAESTNPSRSPQTTRANTSARSGVQPSAVTERDVLKYIVYYGETCQNFSSQLSALIPLVDGR